MKLRRKIAVFLTAAMAFTAAGTVVPVSAAVVEGGVSADSVTVFRLKTETNTDTETGETVENVTWNKYTYGNGFATYKAADTFEAPVTAELGYIRAGFGSIAEFNVQGMPSEADLENENKKIVLTLTKYSYSVNDKIGVWLWDDSVTVDADSAPAVKAEVDTLYAKDALGTGGLSIDLTDSWNEIKNAAGADNTVRLFFDDAESQLRYYAAGDDRPKLEITQQQAVVNPAAHSTITEITNNNTVVSAEQSGAYSIKDGTVTALFTAADGYYFKSTEPNATTATVTVEETEGKDIVIEAPEAYLPDCKIVKGTDNLYFVSINDAVTALEENDTLVLLKDAEVGPDRLNIEVTGVTVTSAENGPYTIKAADNLQRDQLILVAGAGWRENVSKTHPITVNFVDVNIDSGAQCDIAIEFKSQATINMNGGVNVSGDIYSQSARNNLIINGPLTVTNGAIVSRNYNDDLTADTGSKSYLHIYDKTYTNEGDDTQSKINAPIYLNYADDDTNESKMDILYGPGTSSQATEIKNGSFILSELWETDHRTTDVEGAAVYENNASPFECTLNTYPQKRILTYRYDKTVNDEYTNQKVEKGEWENIAVNSIKFTSKFDNKKLEVTKRIGTEISGEGSIKFALILAGASYGNGLDLESAKANVTITALP